MGAGDGYLVVVIAGRRITPFSTSDYAEVIQGAQSLSCGGQCVAVLPLRNDFVYSVCALYADGQLHPRF